jgi:hypothetical protein
MANQPGEKSILLRVSVEKHQEIVEAARFTGQTLNSWLSNTVDLGLKVLSLPERSFSESTNLIRANYAASLGNSAQVAYETGTSTRTDSYKDAIASFSTTPKEG